MTVILTNEILIDKTLFLKSDIFHYEEVTSRNKNSERLIKPSLVMNIVILLERSVYLFLTILFKISYLPI